MKEHIHLTTVDSTNRFLKDLADERKLDNWFVVSSDFQSDGKGQRGNVWLADEGRNVLASIYYKPTQALVDNSFILNQWVSLAVLEVLRDLGLDEVQVKWPNDILVNGKKICGILIENSIQGDLITESIIGIGLNVNSMPEMDTVSSIAKEKGVEYSPMMVLKKVQEKLMDTSDVLTNQKGLGDRYLSNLYGYQQHVLLTDFVEEFTGMVTGVMQDGKILIQRSGEELTRQFNFQEIKWLGSAS